MTPTKFRIVYRGPERGNRPVGAGVTHPTGFADRQGAGIIVLPSSIDEFGGREDGFLMLV